MKTAVMTSFADLARMFGSTKRAEQIDLDMFEHVKQTAGRPAALIFAFMNDAESRPFYGKKGEILHDLARLSAGTGLSPEEVKDGVTGLLSMGLAKPIDQTFLKWKAA